MALLCLQNRCNDDFRRFYLFPSITMTERLSFTKNGKFLARGTRLRSLVELYNAVITMDNARMETGGVARVEQMSH